MRQPKRAASMAADFLPHLNADQVPTKCVPIKRVPYSTLSMYEVNNKLLTKENKM